MKYFLVPYKKNPMSPLKNQLKKVERKLGYLESLRKAQKETIDPSKPSVSKVIKRFPEDIDQDIQNTYRQYSILKIRYLMEIF
ncbi:MAG: hypothetical protein U9N53_00935 [Bacteroidota bacterium]|nr:hypothetical protein [Bacteroidota bacterium]